MHQKMDIAVRELNAIALTEEENPKIKEIMAALRKLTEGLEAEFRDLHREDERTKERIKNSRP